MEGQHSLVQEHGGSEIGLSTSSFIQAAKSIFLGGDRWKVQYGPYLLRPLTGAIGPKPSTGARRKDHRALSF